MKSIAIVGCVIALVVAGCKPASPEKSPTSAASETNLPVVAARSNGVARANGNSTNPLPSGTSPEAEAMQELRTMVLTMPASKAGAKPSANFPKVFGVVMDFPVGDGHIASVVGMHDGHASLYTTATFGVLGGIGQQSVRSAVTNFVQAAQGHYDEATPTAQFPHPAEDRVRFYLLGFDGVRVVDTEIEGLESGKDARSKMWMAGQEVLTQLRLLSEKKQR